VGLEQRAITLDRLIQTAEYGIRYLDRVRDAMLTPDYKKLPPEVSLSQLGDLLNVSDATLYRRISSGKWKVEDKVQHTRGQRRMFSMEQAREILQIEGYTRRRQEGVSGSVCTVANFKGGSGKTSQSVALSQYMASRGYDVLLIDLDPQGSATTLMGLLPDTHVKLEDTAFLAMNGEQDNLDYAIKSTYWPGLDIVPAATPLSMLDYILPAAQAKDASFSFYTRLREVLGPSLQRYDFVVIDTPPQLSYMTLNALYAADGVVVPVPPATLDFASTTQFFRLFTDICNQIHDAYGDAISLCFFHILMTRVDPNERVSELIREHLAKVFGTMLLPDVIPRTSAVGTASAKFGTVYDRDFPGTAQTRLRATHAFDNVNKAIVESMLNAWGGSLNQMLYEASIEAAA